MKAVSAKEQAELIDIIVKGKAQSIAVHIKKSPPENLDINARVPGGVHVGLTPLHCAVKHTRDPLVVVELLDHDLDDILLSLCGALSDEYKDSMRCRAQAST